MRRTLRRTVLFIFGTRPEAIKLCPLLLKLRSFPELYSTKVCVTGQHRGMLDQILAAFAVTPDYDLNVMTPGQTLFQSTARIIQALEQPFAESKPDLAVVQGDTTTTFCGALAAFYSGVPVAHVEAGLRTGDLRQPFPEELNRVLDSQTGPPAFRCHDGCGGVFAMKASPNTCGLRATPASTRFSRFATASSVASCRDPARILTETASV